MGEKEEDVQHVKDKQQHKSNKAGIVLHPWTEEFRTDNEVMTLEPLHQCCHNSHLTFIRESFTKARHSQKSRKEGTHQRMWSHGSNLRRCKIAVFRYCRASRKFASLFHPQESRDVMSPVCGPERWIMSHRWTAVVPQVEYKQPTQLWNKRFSDAYYDALPLLLSCWFRSLDDQA